MIKQESKISLKNTGERMIPQFSEGKLVYGEHIIRYKAALGLAKNKIVLDIASGSGYGTAMLGMSAKKAIGVDINKNSVDYSNQKYGSKKVSYVVGDGIKIPLEDGSVDVVVSFETIEHIKDYEKFMSEIKRVLKPDGVLILSTPNDLEYPEGNHFHIHEFTPKELQKLTDKYFSYSKAYYQGTWLYNAILDEKTLALETEFDINTLQLAPIKVKQSVYLYLICSDKRIPVQIPRVAAMSEHWSERKHIENDQAIQAQTIEHIATIRRLEKTIDEKHSEIVKLLAERKSIMPYIKVIPNLPKKILNKYRSNAKTDK
ncbi:MAG: methyltransferase domain-containing protein [bacterium]|nr:methyltransferase domain-containing protein [bacterium]